MLKLVSPVILPHLAAFALAQGNLAVALEDDSSSTAFAVNRAVDVIAQWKPHQRLYVKGDVGVGRDQLNALELWLDQHGTNWTVVLVDSAVDEEFVDAESNRHKGMDAVENALGRGLANRTAFGQWTDLRTQERNGAVFVLFLKDRKISYFGSDAQDKRGLGESAWVGKLDQPALTAMRDGARVVDAAKDTISTINLRLNQRIDSEIADRERRAAVAKEQSERNRQRATANITTASGAVALLEQKSAELKQLNLSGDLARPDLAQFSADLASAKAALESGNFTTAVNLSERVRQQSESLIRAIEEHRGAPEKFEALAGQIDRQARRPHAVRASVQLRHAADALAKSREEHGRGSSVYVAHLETAYGAAGSAESAITDAERASEYAQRFFGLLGLVAMASLAGVGFGLNRRRRKAMASATELLNTWETGLNEKNTALFQLIERVQMLIGKSAAEAAARYGGETRRLSEQIIKDVDELFIMSASTGRILAGARVLIEPKGTLRRCENLFARRRFEAAIRLLRDEPIAFRPEEAVELIVRGSKRIQDTLLGELESYQPFKMSFTQLIDEFNVRGKRVLEGLDTLESSLIQAGPTLDGVQNTIYAVRAKEEELSGLAVFSLPSMFSHLLPAAQIALSEALKIAIPDPVGALRSHGSDAKRMAGDALALADLAATYRKDCSPRLQAAAAALSDSAVSTGWIEAAVGQLSDSADETAQAALKEGVANRVSQIAGELAHFTQRTETAVALDKARRETAQESISKSEEQIEQARRNLAEALELNPERLLRETGVDPSDRVRLAREQLAATKAALDRGDVAAARNALDVIVQLTTEANEIVAASEEALAQHHGRLAERVEETQRLTGLMPGHAARLERIERKYARSVLLLGSADPAHPNANATIADNLEEVQSHLRSCQELAQRAGAAHQSGSVLEAREFLKKTQARQETAVNRLQEIEEKETRLEKVEAANRLAFSQLDIRLRECQPIERDRRTTRETLALLAEARAAVDEIRSGIQSTRNDPFQINDTAETAASLLDQCTERARQDRESFAEAEKSVHAAEAQLQKAQRLASQAASDQIVDSPDIVQSRKAIVALTPEIRRLGVKLEEEHQNWLVLDSDADRLGMECSRHDAVLRRELDQAEAASHEVTAAATAVRTAGSWNGSYGVRIMGSPGSNFLSAARMHLQSGAYDAARSSAESARRAATEALLAAEAEVRRIRREEEERLEHEKRRRRAEELARRRRFESSPSWSGGGGVFRSSGGRSTFSSGSGMRRSSSSSGSGFSRSGW